jgi:hypothetical protein
VWIQIRIRIRNTDHLINETIISYLLSKGDLIFKAGAQLGTVAGQMLDAVAFSVDMANKRIKRKTDSSRNSNMNRTVSL